MTVASDARVNFSQHFTASSLQMNINNKIFVYELQSSDDQQSGQFQDTAPHSDKICFGLWII
jgi:hypothetical protein